MASPRYPASTLALTWGNWVNRSAMPSVRTAVWSCIRPGRTRWPTGCAFSSAMTVAFFAFCFLLPTRTRGGPACPHAGA